MARSASSYSVVKTASAAIFNAHKMAGYSEAEIPTKHQMCKSVREAAKRELGTQVKNRKDPVSLETLLAMVALLTPRGAPIWAVSLAALAMTCFAGFLRYSDCSVILVGDVKFYDTHMEIFIGKRKNDQFRKGMWLPLLGVLRLLAQ